MGRKKIEIRPLVDERNRNVTFLKRKAGLMKKAWELSVLCGADVSIMIFSSNGKPYEFSSKELDVEIDRYLDYEGVIERRRAPEFAAMALAEEEDDDEEDDLPSRRGSSSKLPSGMIGAPPKSLKGKETFKPHMTSRAELARAVAERKGKAKGKGREEKREVGEGMVEDSSGDSSSESEEVGEEKPITESMLGHGADGGRERSRQRAPSSSTGMAGLTYTLNLHNLPQSSASPHPPHPPTNGMYPYPQPANIHQVPCVPRSQSYRMENPQNPYQQIHNFPPANYNHHSFFTPTPQPQPLLPNNMQWDPNLLSRYAEYQLQQNHHRQQRALLERQRQQLAELGIPVEDKSPLDQLFGGGMASTETSTLQSELPFEWPEVGHGQPKGQAQSRGYNQNLGTMFGEQQSQEMVWPMSEEGPLPSPASAEEAPRRDKRDREKGDTGREGKRHRVP